MGEMVSFPSNGTDGQGYFAVPESGSGPGLVVFQEWWGMNDQLKEVCDRWAADGFVALAPDMYRGEVSLEPDEAKKLMMSLNIERAAKDMKGAVEYLKGHSAVTSKTVGVTGYCMGGGLALWLATIKPDDVSACVSFYGLIPWPAAQPDFSKMKAAVQGHSGEDDPTATPELIGKLEEQLQGAGVKADFYIYPGCDHAFTNHRRPEVYNEEQAEIAYKRALDFFRDKVK